MRIVFGFMIIMVIFLLIAGIFIFTNFLFQLTDINTIEVNYRVFLLESFATGSLILTGLTLCAMFLYLIIVIVFRNPQKVSKNTVLKFSLGGIFVLLLTGGLIYYGGSFTYDCVLDMKDYSNGDWKEEELLVKNVEYMEDGDYIIEADHREFFVFGLPITITEGETYRFTFLDRTSHVLKIEKLK